MEEHAMDSNGTVFDFTVQLLTLTTMFAHLK